jgi:hypothetical protein
MRNLGSSLLIFLLAGVALAGTCPDPATSAKRALIMGNFDHGTLITATLANRLGTHHSWYDKFGFVPDSRAVVAWIDYDLVCEGKTVIPKGSRLVGRVPERSEYDDRHSRSALTLVFTTLEIKGLPPVNLAGKVVALAPPKGPPLDVHTVGTSGFDGVELNKDGTITSTVLKNVSFPVGTQILVFIDFAVDVYGNNAYGYTRIARSLAQKEGCTPGPRSPLLPGTELVLNLEKGIKSTTAKVGDVVTARTVFNVTCFAVPTIFANSRVTGHITKVKTAAQPDDESHLGIVFDTVQVSKRRTIKIEGMLQQLEVPTPFISVETCGVSSVSASDGSPAVTCSGGDSGAIYVTDKHFKVDQASSVISSRDREIKIHSRDRLIVDVAAVE